MGMYIIAEPCIGTKDTACVDVCPVDCIHPRKDEADFETAEMLYIDPDVCIQCGNCEPACPGDRDLHGRDDPRQVEALPAGQRGLVQEPAGVRRKRSERLRRSHAHVSASLQHPREERVRPRVGVLRVGGAEDLRDRFDDANPWPASG